MARKKVKLAYIANDAARRSTFKKRKKGLLKKVSELSILCNVEACAIVYGPYEPQPEVWPPNSPDASRVLARFRSMPEMEQSKKKLSQEGFLRLRISKLQEQIKKQDRDTREIQMEVLMRQCLAGRGLDNLNVEEATSLGRMVEKKMKELQEQVEILRRKMAVVSVMKGGEETSVRVSVDHGVAGEKSPPVGMDGTMEALQRSDWFMEMMNPPEQLYYGGVDEMVQPSFVDGSSQWLDAFFPHY